MAFWFFRKKDPDYENVLPKLAKEIKAHKAALLRAKYAHRRWPFMFLLGSSVVYIVVLALFIGRLNRSPSSIAFLGLGPFFIWITRNLITRFTLWRQTHVQNKLDSVVEKRHQLVEAFKEKTNFEKIQKLVDEDYNDETSTQSGTQNGTQNGTQTTPSNEPTSQDPQPQNVSINLPSNQPGLINQLNRPDLRYEPVSVYKSSWVDRLIDLIIGENENSPANRQALICKNCHVHNGLAPFGQSADEVQYICPFCGTKNNPKKEEIEEPKQTFELPEPEPVKMESGDENEDDEHKNEKESDI